MTVLTVEWADHGAQVILSRLQRMIALNVPLVDARAKPRRSIRHPNQREAMAASLALYVD